MHEWWFGTLYYDLENQKRHFTVKHGGIMPAKWSLKEKWTGFRGSIGRNGIFIIMFSFGYNQLKLRTVVFSLA